MKNIGKAIILSEGKYKTIDGKTAHGLIRYSGKYEIVGVIDSTLAGKDAGEVVNCKRRGVKIYSSIEEILKEQQYVKYLIVGIATSGGELPPEYRETIKKAIQNRIHIINGLHSFLSEDMEYSSLAKYYGTELIDIRKLFGNQRIFFSGKINDVAAYKVAVLGTDSAIGKRTTATMIYQCLKNHGRKCTFIAMGQTGWMQGFKHCIVLDAIVLDFVTGAIEEVIWNAWNEELPDFIVTHGEGAMLHPACPGGFELIAAGRPDFIILQHSPMRGHYDDFPMYKMDSLEKNIDIIQLYSNKKLIAITLNSEGMSDKEALCWAGKIENEFGLMTRVPFIQGVGDLVSLLISRASFS